MTTKTAKATEWYGKKWGPKDDLLAPLRTKQPRLLVDRYPDLFAPEVKDEDVDEIFGVMIACLTLEPVSCPDFVVLTRHVHRMEDYFKTDKHKLVERWAKALDGKCHINDGDTWFSEYVGWQTAHAWEAGGVAPRGAVARPFHHIDKLWPLPNLMLGVYVPDQAAVDRRLPVLVKMPAGTKIAVCEPLRGPVDLLIFLYSGFTEPPYPDKIDVVVAGGDVGTFGLMPDPMDLAWIRALRAQCDKVKAPFHITKLGRRPIGKWGKTDVIEPRMNNRPGREGEFMLRSRDGIDRDEWPLDLRTPPRDARREKRP